MKTPVKLIAAFVFFTVVLPANAEVITVSTEGVLSGRDGIGWFATPGAILENVPYKFTFSYDRNLVGIGWTSDVSDVVLGGDDFSPIKTSLIVGGKSAVIEYTRALEIANYIFDGEQDAIPDYYGLAAWAGPRTGDGSFWIAQDVRSANGSFVKPFPKLGDTMSYQVQLGDLTTGRFAFYDGRATIPGTEWSEFATTISMISARRQVGTIPEPGSLALIALGLLLVYSFGNLVDPAVEKQIRT